MAGDAEHIVEQASVASDAKHIVKQASVAATQAMCLVVRSNELRQAFACVCHGTRAAHGGGQGRCTCWGAPVGLRYWQKAGPRGRLLAGGHKEAGLEVQGWLVFSTVALPVCSRTDTRLAASPTPRRCLQLSSATRTFPSRAGSELTWATSTTSRRSTRRPSRCVR